MKKFYKKPVIEFDSYELDEFVATCANPTPNHTKATCSMDFGGINLFYVGPASTCEADASELGNEQDNDGFCYHIPDENAQYFGS
ncbi:MAG: hypothetical protein ACI4E0_06385 [Blautia sp.]